MPGRCARRHSMPRCSRASGTRWARNSPRAEVYEAALDDAAAVVEAADNASDLAMGLAAARDAALAGAGSPRSLHSVSRHKDPIYLRSESCAGLVRRPVDVRRI